MLYWFSALAPPQAVQQWYSLDCQNCTGYFSNFNKIQVHKGRIPKPGFLNSDSIHVVFVLGTYTTTDSAAVVLTGLTKLYPHFLAFFGHTKYWFRIDPTKAGNF